MRIGINLASRPYQDEAHFYQLWGAALGFMVLLTTLLVVLLVQHDKNARKEWATARAAEARLAELRKEAAQAQQILAEPQNRGTRDRSQFLNIAILRKSFSWTRLMEDMEKVMPPGLRVTSISPMIDQHNHFVLKVEVEGPKRESAIELLRNMEKSQHFRSSQLVSESVARGSRTTETEVKSDIRTSYLPAEPLETGEGE
jgi:type IV pilus assembly protein PilN